MTRHYAIATLILLAFLLFDRPVEYERFPEWNKAERAAIKQIIKQHGNVTIIRCDSGTYFRRDGEIIWISRRG